MEKNFMINIKYAGRQIYANVFEYRHSPAVYHVHFIEQIEPTHLTLHEEDGQIIPDPAAKSNPELVRLVITAIENNPNRI